METEVEVVDGKYTRQSKEWLVACCEMPEHF